MLARLAVLTLSCVAMSAAAQQDWPARTVTLVNPFAAGSAVDVVARLVAQQLSTNVGQQFVVENRTGASGNIGTEHVARAKPDGYTILVGSPGTMAINPWLFPKLPYDAVGDFVPVTQLVSFPQVLVVHPGLPIRTVAELIGYIKARPGKVNFSSSGNGSTSHLVMELVRAEAKLDMIHVPYRGGSPAIQALIAGDVQVAVEGLPSLPGHLKSSAVRPVAVTSGKRAPSLPEVPALAETIPNFDASAWVILFMPAGAPPAAIDRMATEARRALTDPAVRSRLSEMGATADGTSVADTLRFHRSELAKFRRAVEISGAKPDQ